MLAGSCGWLVDGLVAAGWVADAAMAAVAATVGAREVRGMVAPGAAVAGGARAAVRTARLAPVAACGVLGSIIYMGNLLLKIKIQ